MILLSKTRSKSEEDNSWQFDTRVDAWDEWCMVNVMLIRRLSKKAACGTSEHWEHPYAMCQRRPGGES